MTMEVGKKYKHPLNPHGVIVHCVGKDLHGRAIIQAVSSVGHEYPPSYTSCDENTYKEYKEPVVHRRDVVWVQEYGSEEKEIFVLIREVGGSIGTHWSKFCHELHRQTVEYVEQE